MDNSVNSQVYKPGTAITQTNTAFTNTRGIVINHFNGSSMTQMAGFYKAGTYGSARDSSSYNFYNNVYQNGTHYFGDKGKSYTYMSTYYYPETNLVTGNGF